MSNFDRRVTLTDEAKIYVAQTLHILSESFNAFISPYFELSVERFGVSGSLKNIVLTMTLSEPAEDAEVTHYFREALPANAIENIDAFKDPQEKLNATMKVLEDITELQLPLIACSQAHFTQLPKGILAVENNELIFSYQPFTHRPNVQIIRLPVLIHSES